MAPAEPRARRLAGAASDVAASAPEPRDRRSTARRPRRSSRIGEELFAWLKTLASAAVYATLIVTFGFQVARVEGQSMAPTLADQDRLIVNKLAYRLGEPQVGDIVMLYYPLNPDKSFVKRVIAEEGDQVRIVDGRVYRNDVPINDDYVPAGVPQPRRLGPGGGAAGLLLRDGRPPEQQLRQPALGLRAEEIHHRQGAAALVADAARADVLGPDSALTARAGFPAFSLRVLVLNLAVAGAKLLFGYATGAVSIISDGFHSLTDSASNVMGLVGLRASRQAARRRSSLRPPQVRDARGRRHLRVPAAGGRRGACERVSAALAGGDTARRDGSAASR